MEQQELDELKKVIAQSINEHDRYTIGNAIEETAQRVEAKIIATLGVQIAKLIEPINREALKNVNKDFEELKGLLQEVGSNLFGALAIRSAIRRMEKKENLRKKVVEHENTIKQLLVRERLSKKLNEKEKGKL
jgi:uncharacterized iron-regulated protein